MTDKLWGSCGLLCTECPAYQATQAGDEDKARATAEEWSKAFKVAVRIEDVWCDGCRTPGRKCAHCGECEIRSCATGRSLATCADCADYPSCATIQGFFAMAPMARDSLEKLRASR